MNKICEMNVNDFFKLSSGHIAFVREVIPNRDKFIADSKADLYINVR